MQINKAEAHCRKLTQAMELCLIFLSISQDYLRHFTLYIQLMTFKLMHHIKLNKPLINRYYFPYFNFGI